MPAHENDKHPVEEMVEKVADIFLYHSSGVSLSYVKSKMKRGDKARIIDKANEVAIKVLLTLNLIEKCGECGNGIQGYDCLDDCLYGAEGPECYECADALPIPCPSCFRGHVAVEDRV